jgi:Raf kinase inhibitor-like YbhB/YbcL family protein
MALITQSTEGTQQTTLKLHSTHLDHADTIPHRYRALEEDLSPPMAWSGMPPATRTLVLTMVNPDPVPEGRTHWLVYNIPASRSALPEGVCHCGDLSDGTQQGVNDFSSVGWHGPNPRPGSASRYHFRLYALDTPLPLGAGASRQEVLRAMRGHVLSEATLSATASTPLFNQR